MSDHPADRQHSLTLWFYPSPYGVDWSTPRTLARSVVLNQFSRMGRAIGHVHIELRDPEGRRHLTGMSQEFPSDQRRVILIDRIGLGVLFHSFQGRIEQPSEIVPEIERRCHRGNFSFLKILISPAAHARALKWFEEYPTRAGREGRIEYGLPNRPLYGEGSGCSAFGASFLEVAGVLDDEFRGHWSRTIRVPERWIGVSLLALLNPFAESRWAGEGEPHRSVFFWDPDLMHRWVMEKVRGGVMTSEPRFDYAEKGRAQGLVMDRRSTATPSGPIWK